MDQNSVTREDSLNAIKSWWDDEYPSAETINSGQDIMHSYARGMIDLHLSLFAYDGNKDIEDLRTEVWESIFPTPKPRFWILGTLSEDDPGARAFGEHTVGIVDEDQGGIILYVHKNNAEGTLKNLLGE